MMTQDEIDSRLKSAQESFDKAQLASASAKTPEEVKAAMEQTAAAVKTIKDSMDAITNEIFKAMG